MGGPPPTAPTPTPTPPADYPRRMPAPARRPAAARRPSRLDELLDAFDEVEGADAVDVLAELRAAHDRGEWRDDLPLIGDFYVALSDEADDDEDHDVARQLRAEAVGLPASDPQWVIGAHLADDYDADPRGQLARLRDAADGLAGPQHARLLAAFAEGIEPIDASTAADLLEEALPLAIAARDAGDDDTYGTVIVPRALLRASERIRPDDHDLAADALLGAIEAAERGGPIADPPPQQLFVRLQDLPEAARRWPEDFPDGSDTAATATFYAELEAGFRAHHADYQQAFQLQPLSFALADAHHIDLSADPIDAPDAFWQELAAEEPPLTWPPGRNDPCWCGSGRKYKRCCGNT